MVIETLKEKLNINKLVATKKEMIMVEGDMIVPDSKPDILNTISTSGIVSVYKKEVLEGKVRIDGNINTYIMYMAEDENDKIRGITTTLDFSEIIQISNITENMNCDVKTTLKNIESKIINGRKVGIKASLELEIKVYSKEEVSFVRDIPDNQGIKMLKKSFTINSLVGMGENKFFAKDTLAINNTDNLAEILKAKITLGDNDVKISYNKILTKAEANVKIMYLTEDNRIGTISSKIPIVGFIDIPDVKEENMADVIYEIKNIVIKPNTAEEHSIYVELEIGVTAFVYEEKQIQLIQDLYSLTENVEFNQRTITTMANKTLNRGIKQIREKMTLEGLDNKNIIDVDIIPAIENERKEDNRIIYEGKLELNFILANDSLQIETRTIQIPFEYTVENIDDLKSKNTEALIDIINQDFVVQDGGIVNCNIDLQIDIRISRNTTIKIIDEIQTVGEREQDDYSIIMYVVKKGDSLWKIAKKFGSSVEDIARTNGIEDENLIMPGQKLFIPHYTRVPIESNG